MTRISRRLRSGIRPAHGWASSCRSGCSRRTPPARRGEWLAPGNEREHSTARRCAPATPTVRRRLPDRRRGAGGGDDHRMLCARMSSSRSIVETPPRLIWSAAAARPRSSSASEGLARRPLRPATRARPRRPARSGRPAPRPAPPAPASRSPYPPLAGRSRTPSAPRTTLWWRSTATVPGRASSRRCSSFRPSRRFALRGIREVTERGRRQGPPQPDAGTSPALKDQLLRPHRRPPAVFQVLADTR